MTIPFQCSPLCPARRRWRCLAAMGLTALAVLPGAAAPDFKAQFSRLDANSDGVLSVDEFLGPRSLPTVARSDVVIETRDHTRLGDDGKPRSATSDRAGRDEEEVFAFYLPDELGGGERRQGCGPEARSTSSSRVTK